MSLQQLKPIRNFLKATKFWQENYIILREFKHFRRIAILALLFTFTAAAFEGFGVGFLLAFLQSLTDPQAEPVRTGINWFDVWFLGINAPATERLYRVSGLILFVTLLRTGFTYLGQVYSEIANHNLADRLRKRLFEQFQAVSLSYYSKTRSGELVNSLTSEINQVCLAFGITAFFFIRGSTLIAYLISMLMLSWQLTVISVLLFTLLSAAISTLLGRVREASFEWTKAAGSYASIALEFINGIRTVQAFATQDFERERFYAASSRFQRFGC
jgi:ATP-binding cassette, subfamily B, bacterial MsbA